MPALQFNYSHSAAPKLINNGHTVQVNLPPGNTLKVGDNTYELLQFHFHTPSEEKITVENLTVDLDDMLPAKLAYYSFERSNYQGKHVNRLGQSRLLVDCHQ